MVAEPCAPLLGGGKMTVVISGAGAVGGGAETMTPPCGASVPGSASTRGGAGAGAGATITLNGANVPGGVAVPGSTTSLLSTQFGPLTSMHSGLESGRLSTRSLVSTAMAGAMLARKIRADAGIRCIFVPPAKADISNIRGRGRRCMQFDNRISAHRLPEVPWQASRTRRCLHHGTVAVVRMRSPSLQQEAWISPSAADS
jgi:hypothetical protein